MPPSRRGTQARDLVDSPSGRAARIGGAGLNVWEVVADFQALGQE
jgi:uncharacterized MAPEG superfamily protein